MKYDVIIAGGGIAGLTSAAYLSKEGLKVLICEKENHVGGLVNSFKYKGFTFDGGIRAIENSGIVMPMLRQLGIEIPFKRSIVSLGIEDDIIKVETKENLQDYRKLLIKKFPENESDINKIIQEIEKIMKYMDILYGIDNPLFMDMMKNKKYLFFTVLPWLIKYLFTVGKINKLNTPVEDYLASLTSNQALNDVIAQHFFKRTPTFFALSYFSLYLDYQYPIEGTGMIIEKLTDFIKSHGGSIKTSTEIVSVDAEERIIETAKGELINYEQLIWAADLNRLYSVVELDKLNDEMTKLNAKNYKKDIENLRGGDSIQTTYLTLDLDVSYFEERCTEHFFYTPVKSGLTPVLKKLPGILDSTDFSEIMEWVKEYLEKTTYEISIPAMRNQSLAPKGKTGLIVSTLMDFDLVKKIDNMGMYENFKSESENHMIRVLEQSFFAGINEKIIDKFSSTPLTIEKITGNKDGAITGWAFTNPTMPVINRVMSVTDSVLTKITDIFQAGQWSYSPAGLPISIMTGKLAADQVIKKRKKVRGK
jgi:phytoene dehydrogenase-like protein